MRIHSRPREHTSRSTRLVALAVATGLGAAFSPASWGSVAQPAGVSEDPVDFTPSLVATGVAKPIVDAVAQSGDTVFAGGSFGRLTRAGQTFERTNLAVFSASTGVMSGVALNPNGRVRALASIGGWVYVGGEFTSIGGTTKRNLVRVNAATGLVDPGFSSAVHGRVNVLVAANDRLYVGGTFAAKLVALNPRTGADTGAFNLTISGGLPNAWGGVTIQGMAINPQGTRLVATGNFMLVDGKPRSRLFVADLGGGRATLDAWYYPAFARACSSTEPRRIAYLQGVDFSPGGRYFAVSATGAGLAPW